MPKETVTPEEINGMCLQSLVFERQGYRKVDGEVHAKARFWNPESNYGDVKEIEFNLDQQISKDLMKVLLPLVTERAAQAAQRLADDAKAMANALSDSVLKQLEEKNGD